MRKNIFLAAGLLILIIMFKSVSGWAVPNLINYQSKLSDAEGVPLDGTYEITFYLYDVETGGMPIWSENRSVVVSQGVVNVQLGAVESLSSDIFEIDKLYIEISIYNPDTGLDEFLSPRHRLTSAAFAIRAGSADTVAGKVASEFLDTSADTQTKSGDLNITGNVGIGTTNPVNKLQTEGGSAEFVTETGAYPLKISRNHKTSDYEELRFNVTDNTGTIHYINDEASNRLDFRMQNTDTENGGSGQNANDRVVMSIVGNAGRGRIELGGLSIGPTLGSAANWTRWYLGFGMYWDGDLDTGNWAGGGTYRSIFINDNDKLRYILGMPEGETSWDHATLQSYTKFSVDRSGNVWCNGEVSSRGNGYFEDYIKTPGNGYFDGKVGIGTTYPMAKLQICGPYGEVEKRIMMGNLYIGPDLGPAANWTRWYLGYGMYWGGGYETGNWTGGDTNRSIFINDNETLRFIVGMPAGETSWDHSTLQDYTKFAVDKFGNGYFNGGLWLNEGNIHLNNNIYMNNNRWIGVSNYHSLRLTSGDTGQFRAKGSIIMYIDSDNNSTERLFLVKKDTNDSGGVELFRVQENGNVGIGTTNPEYSLHVTGDIAYTGNIYDISDLRLKENITPLENAVEKVSSINGVYFNNIGKPSYKREVGVIAQDVESVLPEVISKNAEGYMSVDYSKLTPLLVEAIKELKAELDELRSEVDELRSENTALR